NTELASILSHINNQSLIEGVFPNQLKIAKVVPVFKSGDSKLVSNYRPISILPTFSKIFEKVVYTRLEKYLIDNAILHKNQFGFRSKLSTCMALLELLDKLSASVDNKSITVGVFIDLAKAFDTVDHCIMLRKLQHYGIRGIPLEWFNSYLSNRKQCVVVDKTESEFVLIKCGVPQGSILGPILFLIYINDLNYASKLLQTIMFADDTNLFLTGKSLQQIETQLNEEMLVINEWFKSNKLSLNLTKTSYIIFGNKTYQDLNIFMHNTRIERQYDAKFLGVILTSKLNWNKHIEIILSKTSKCLGIISKVRHLIPLHLTRMLYLTLVEPYLSYCNLVWCSPGKSSILEKVFKIQKKYCRLITFSAFRATTKPLFLQLKLLTIYNIYKFQLATYMYRILNSLIPALDHHNFKTGSTIHDYNTRHKNDLRKPQCRTGLRQKMICFQGPKLWNILPDNIKNAPSLSTFRLRAKYYFISS
ncbi:MAG: reverse transcriptase family protein, partial [Oscillospiraceae bacterium]